MYDRVTVSVGAMLYRCVATYRDDDSVGFYVVSY